MIDAVTFTPSQVPSAPIFVAVPLLESDGTLYTEVRFDIAGNTLKSIGVIGNGSTRVTGDEVLRFVIGEKIATDQDPVPKRDAVGNAIPGETVTGVGFDLPKSSITPAGIPCN